MPAKLAIENIQFDAKALDARPLHAAVLGRIFTSWSLIEGTIAGLLGLMMHADDRAALAILQTFKTNHARVNAVRKVGAEMLPAELKTDFDKLMQSVTSYATERNAIAHNLWGVKEDEPELVYRIPMAAISGLLVKAPTMDHDAMVAFVEPIKAAMKSFTVSDLEKIEKRGQQVLDDVMKETVGKMYTRAVQIRDSGAAGSDKGG